MPRGTKVITVVGGYSEEDTDWQGDPVEDAEPIEDRDLTGCIVWPVTTRDRPDMVLDSRGVFVPVGNIPPDDHDELLYDGQSWSIDGAVGPLEKKNGRPVGWTFSIRKVT